MKEMLDTTIIAVVSDRFPELLDDLTCFGWLWVKAAGEIVRLNGEDELAAFTESLAKHYRNYPEIPDCQERLLFALVAQGCSPEMVGKALAVARDACGVSPSFTLWRRAGSLPGRWQTWSFTRQFLSHPVCLTRGEFPDQLGLTRYISQIGQRYQRLIAQTGAA
ncbi:MAG: hypothetical protein L3J63_10810 [Geopsychrobacter sp.]|nr:hypothetical protein [Geopsychrobacter sp.]